MSRGVTLVEIVVVLALISILAAVAVPQLPRATEANLRPQADRLASDLRRARMLAMTQSRSLCISANSAGYSVGVFTTATGCSSAINDPLSGTFSVTLPTGMSLSCAGCVDFRFRSNGAPSGAATFVIQASPSRLETVRVSADSGEVRVL